MRGERLLFGTVAGFLLCLVAVVGIFLSRRVDQVDSRLTALASVQQELLAQMDELRLRVGQVEQEAQQAAEYARSAVEGWAETERERRVLEQQAREARQAERMAREEVQAMRSELEAFRRAREEEIARLQQALNQIAKTRRTALGLVMNLGSDTINFDFDKAELRPKEREILSRIAGILLTSRGYRIQIWGHTDDIGSDEYNLELSRRRAEAVRDYFVKAGIDPSVISTKGFGKSRPLVPGTSPEARAKNRRVEIGIVDTLVKYEKPVDAGP
ncbi:MAG: hypothetical protein Kow00109_00210 [Acidobacteriota bacterium]